MTVSSCLNRRSQADMYLTFATRSSSVMDDSSMHSSDCLKGGIEA